MVDLTLDQALPVVQDLAGWKANAFGRRCRLGVDEREDVPTLPDKARKIVLGMADMVLFCDRRPRQAATASQRSAG
ncbi:MAG: hypothetical protein WBW33_12290 [Bryobacteraceae bacterium]